MYGTIQIPSRCGIYYLQTPTSHTETWLPLSNIYVKAHISSYSAQVNLQQVFKPLAGSDTRDAKYCFPIYPSSAVVGFVGRIMDGGTVKKTIRGIIKPIDEAKKRFEQATSQGETAGYLEQTANDCMVIRLGNIPSHEGTEIQIDISYVIELKHDSESDGIRFTIPTAIAARYGSGPPDTMATSGLLVSNGITMDINITMPGPITGVQSPSHPLSVTMGSHGNSDAKGFNAKLAVARFEQRTTTLQNDFVVLILCKEAASPHALMETHMDASGNIESAALMLTFVPKFNIPRGHKKVLKEFIFLVDRSGSMYDKIEPLKASLRVFLKSLSPGTRFNICSFGSTFSFLFNDADQSSQIYREDTLQQALQHVNSFSANFGGTEILAPIQEICERIVRRETRIKAEMHEAGGTNDMWETELLVLTDGEVWNTGPLLNFVSQHSKAWRHGKKDDRSANIRVFTLGIGQNVSHALVEGLAKSGGGYAMVVGDNERFEGKVIRMLKAALSERTGRYQFGFDGSDKWLASLGNKTTADSDDDFELIQSPCADAQQSPAKPISLYDDSADPDIEVSPNIEESIPKVVPPTLIHSPHNIPSLFPFSRCTVYMLLKVEKDMEAELPKSVKLTALTASGQQLELLVPISISSTSNSAMIHQLSAKAYLDDLKSGESWIHQAKESRLELKCINADGKTVMIKFPIEASDDYNPGRFDEVIKKEGERISLKWNVIGKWTAFVALVEEGNEKKPEEATKHSSDGDILYHVNNLGSSEMSVPQASSLSKTMLFSSSVPRTAQPHRAFAAKRSVPSSMAAQQISGGTLYASAPRGMGIAETFMAQSSYAAPPPLPASVSRSIASVPAPSPSPSSPPLWASPQRSATDFRAAALPPSSQKSKSVPKALAREREDRAEESHEKRTVHEQDTVNAIIDCQEFAGYWDVSPSFTRLLGLPSEDTFWDERLARFDTEHTAIADALEVDTRRRLLVTAVVVTHLQARFKTNEDTWDLVVDKATNWMSDILGHLDDPEAALTSVLAFAAKVDSMSAR